MKKGSKHKKLIRVRNVLPYPFRLEALHVQLNTRGHNILVAFK